MKLKGFSIIRVYIVYLTVYKYQQLKGHPVICMKSLMYTGEYFLRHPVCTYIS